jgi:hypothetical protein
MKSDQRCLFCDGHYAEVPMRDSNDMRNYSMPNTQGIDWWRVYECNQCRNVQWFKDTHPRYRKQSG